MNEFIHSGCFAAADTNFAVSGRYIAGTAATQANYVVPVSKHVYLCRQLTNE